MEKINLHNYEAFFLDHAEGNLSVSQKKELDVFLQEHPHLKEELNEFELVSLEQEGIVKSGLQENLKREESTGLLHSEYLMIAQSENVITKEEKEQLSELVEQQPSLVNELALYHKAKLKEEKLVFPSKSELYQKEKPALLWLKYASVAAAAIFTVFLWNSEKETTYSPRQSQYVQTYQDNSRQDVSFAQIVEKKEENVPEEINVSGKEIKGSATQRNNDRIKKTPSRKSYDKNEAVKKSVSSDLQFAENNKTEIEKSDPRVALTENQDKKPEINMPDDDLVAFTNEKPQASTRQDEYIPVKEFAKNKIKNDLLKGKTFSETVLEEIEEASNEKINFERQKDNKGDTRGFAINIGKFSFSKNK